MDTLSEAELDHLWGLLRGHAPGDRAELRTTLRMLVESCDVILKVTRHQVELKMPLALFAFYRVRRNP